MILLAQTDGAPAPFVGVCRATDRRLGWDPPGSAGARKRVGPLTEGHRDIRPDCGPCGLVDLSEKRILHA